MKLFDLHCDTLTELLAKGEDIKENSCHVSLDSALSSFEEYTQVMAIWSDHRQSGEDNYRRFEQAIAYGNRILPHHDRFNWIYGVEGGNLLCGDIKRLDRLYECGVRILTLVWGGEGLLGGAHNTHTGLTDFGKKAVERCYDLGIVPDLSHASDELFYDTAEIAARRGGTVIASHSCSREVFEHTRNLTDDMASVISELGGIIGVNLVTEHLGSDDIERVLEHLSHLAGVVGEDKICLGADLDGTDKLPDGIRGVGDLALIYNRISENKYRYLDADRIFYTNAQNFAKEHLFR